MAKYPRNATKRAHAPPICAPDSHNESAYHRFLSIANSDDAIIADALRIYHAYIAHALCEHHKLAPLALVNVRLRWTLAQVARIVATLETKG